jgi:hypothetical protein
MEQGTTPLSGDSKHRTGDALIWRLVLSVAALLSNGTVNNGSISVYGVPVGIHGIHLMVEASLTAKSKMCS